MFNVTDTPYHFKYLKTGIKGDGIKEVYLPDQPEDSKIHFKKEQKFVRPKMPEAMYVEVRKARLKLDPNSKSYDPSYISLMQPQIDAWIMQEHERCEYGIWFWNNGEATYLTGMHYWYLTAWKTYFGFPIYRETDKEIFYWWKFIEEDPDCYGGCLNTIRRYGKSSFMGAVAMYRTTRNFSHNCGMQGETNNKIKKFYNKMVLKPFYKLPYYHQPTWNTDNKQSTYIEFDQPVERGKRRSSIESDDMEVLESMIDFRASDQGAYDGDVLNTYLLEEPGKAEEASIYNDEGDGTWDIVKPCLRKGRQIRGKALLGTTVEKLNIAERGGKAYKKLFYDSDYNDRQPDGRTKSGLYAAFLPGHHAYEDFLDEWGRPMSDMAMKQLMLERESFRGNHRKLAGQIRKYPVSIVEIFYVSPDHCEFNSEIIQDTLMFIDTSTDPLISRYDLKWKDGVPFSEVVWVRNENHGWFHATWLPSDPKEKNQVDIKYNNGIKFYAPKNDAKMALGCDPIQHGSNDKTKESRPVVTLKRKYDTAIDGHFTEEEIIQNALNKHQYQTNKYVGMMHSRPSDPNVFFERTLLICWYFGVSLHVEKQKAAIINYFYDRNCGDFILHKYKPEHQKPTKGDVTDGTSASIPLTQEFTSSLATYIEYFGHTCWFREIQEDWLIFNAADTRVHDYTVSTGFTELACKMKPKTQQREMVDISELMPILDQFGNLRRN